MAKWKEFDEFINKVVNICSTKTGFKLVFRSKPWDRTGDLIKGGKYYTHANFKGKSDKAEEFLLCVRDIAKSEGVDVLTKKGRVIFSGDERLVSVYFPFDEAEARRIMKETIEITDFGETEELLEEKGLL